MRGGAAVARGVLAAKVAAAVCLLAMSIPATLHAQDARKKVSMRLDWIYQGPNIGFVVAKDKGFYDEVGLDVDVGPGKGSGITAQLVANKAADFGFSDGYVLAGSIAKGMNIRMVAAVYRRNPTAIVYLAESGLKSPKELEGKTIAIPTGATQFQQWPAFMKGCGLDSSKVNVTNVDPAGLLPALLGGKVNAVGTYVQGTVPSVEIRGKKEAGYFWYADCGVTSVSNGIIAHNDMIKDNPELVRNFVKASIRGFVYARQNPDEAAAIVKKYSESLVPEIIKREMELSWATWNTPNTKGKPLGWMSDADWAATVDVIKQYGGVSNLDAKSLYTNDFAPDDAAFIVPEH